MSTAAVFPCGHTENEHLAGWGGQSCTFPISLKPRKMPAQKPGKSVQEVGTPSEFLSSVQRKLGHIAFDLAADRDNRLVPLFYGPGSGVSEDALSQDWSQWSGLLWLNPPYANISVWAAKCAEESHKGAEIALLIPASVGTNYFCDFIFQRSRVFFLSPRLTFVGHTQSYPKDLILCHYGPCVMPGFECWRWKP